MEFTECLKDRLTLTLKSGLLCAVMLIPATALAQSPEIVRGDELTPIATAVEAEDTATDSTPATPAEERKINCLSGHIQRKYQISETKARHIVQEAIRNAERHQLDPELILALIAVESTFKERAVSRVGARGLMQVMPRPHADKVREIGGSHQLFDPTKNIHIGSRILVKYLNNHSGNLRRALLSYNGSLGTRSSFPDRVMRIYRDLQRVTIEG
ncbi:MAG TPA: transglycosylase SLT domain-containing protein [Candidatus Competibacteraceae bacterium]|nr:transglycosylase SLT domain-containing protein [Candidatus Competibacteraceae bacterium]HRZ04993.1 transglycosylase SLT domain-containing protein [Candidatus Competibacteraceae bacterium]HSA45248.1 transglycosylase SLT domain-containing protein [Candidatus Competibacteraceae bacterium]